MLKSKTHSSRGFSRYYYTDSFGSVWVHIEPIVMCPTGRSPSIARIDHPDIMVLCHDPNGDLDIADLSQVDIDCQGVFVKEAIAFATKRMVLGYKPMPSYRYAHTHKTNGGQRVKKARNMATHDLSRM